MKTITHSGLLNLITNTSGTCIVGLTALTDAKARKTGNPFPEQKIFKQVRAVGFCGVDYEASVKREADRQGADAIMFHGSSLPWGQWLIPNKVITHKGELYLRTQSTPGTRRKQPARLICYRDIHGKFISPVDAQPFIPEKVESSKQANRAGLEGKFNQIWVNTYKFSSLLRVRINGKTYNVVPDRDLGPTKTIYHNFVKPNFSVFTTVAH